jgi:hypothetical protein
MNFPFFPRRIDLNDYESVRKHATYLPSAEAAWPIREENGKLPTSEELEAELATLRRSKARLARYREAQARG